MIQQPVAQDATRLRDKFRGALLGTAVGDALGAPFEGQPVVETSRLAHWAAANQPLWWTDDTHMTIGVAESLLDCGGFDGDHMAWHLSRTYHAEPWRGYGAGPPQVFVALARGESWEHAARGLFGGQGSFGNGAAMRVAPAALLAHPNLARIQTVARQTAAITHTHELAQQGASLQACAVGWLLGAQPTAPAPTELAAALVAAVRPSAPAAAFQRRLDLLAEGAAAWPPEQAATAIGNGIEAVEAVPAALYALLGHPDSFADAVSTAVSLGGDTDTIAAMTGAVWRAAGRLGDPARLAGAPGSPPVPDQPGRPPPRPQRADLSR